MKPHPCAFVQATAPAPDLIVVYPSGEFGPLMFHYLCEGIDTRQIAKENGFEMRWTALDDDPAAEAAWNAYEAGDIAKAIELWNPPIPHGWKLAGAGDSEDGLFAIFLRPIAAAPAREPAPQPMCGAAA
jgi:hypothetical protein